MPLLKRKPNGEFEDWRVYTPATNASSSPDSATRKRKVKSEDAGRPGVPSTSSPTSLDSVRPTKRSRKDKHEDSDDRFGVAGDTRSSGTLTGSHVPLMASGTGLQVNNPAAVAGSSTARDTKQGDPSTSTVDSWFSDPTYGYSIPTPSTSQARAPPKAAAISDIKMAPSAAPTPPKALAKAKAKTPREPKPKPEKRGAIFKKKCPQNILDRLDRVIEQRWERCPSTCLTLIWCQVLHD